LPATLEEAVFVASDMTDCGKRLLPLTTTNSPRLGLYASDNAPLSTLTVATARMPAALDGLLVVEPVVGDEVLVFDDLDEVAAPLPQDARIRAMAITMHGAKIDNLVFILCLLYSSSSFSYTFRGNSRLSVFHCQRVCLVENSTTNGQRLS
jgi:hypothetical protein